MKRSRLSSETVAEIVGKRMAGRTYESLETEFGVSRQQIYAYMQRHKGKSKFTKPKKQSNVFTEIQLTDLGGGGESSGNIVVLILKPSSLGSTLKELGYANS